MRTPNRCSRNQRSSLGYPKWHEFPLILVQSCHDSCLSGANPVPVEKIRDSSVLAARRAGRADNCCCSPLPRPGSRGQMRWSAGCRVPGSRSGSAVQSGFSPITCSPHPGWPLPVVTPLSWDDAPGPRLAARGPVAGWERGRVAVCVQGRPRVSIYGGHQSRGSHPLRGA